MKKRFFTLSFVIIMALFSVAVIAADKKQGEITGPHAKMEMACIDCHEVEAPIKRAPQGPCMECHTNKADNAPIKFKDTNSNEYEVSPHASHAGQMRCTLCHKMHEPSVLYCNEGCHHQFILAVP